MAPSPDESTVLSSRSKRSPAASNAKAITSAAEAVNVDPAVAEVRSLLTGVPPELNPSRDDVLRFLRARDRNPQKAAAMLQKDIEWRKRVRPAQVTAADIPKGLGTGWARFIGVTPDHGYCVLLISVANWNPHLFSHDEWEKYVGYIMEHATAAGPRIICLWDFRGYRAWHAAHLTKTRIMIQTFMNHYPERLEAVVALRAPAIFSTLWVAIKALLDPVTAQKVRFAPKEAGELAFILQQVPASMVPKEFGGQLDDGGLPNPNYPGEPSVPITTK